MYKNQLFKNLKPIDDSSFPKACDQCDTHFKNEKDFILNTIAYHKDSGLSEGIDEEGAQFIKLIRVCRCEQPILDYFKDRRASSTKAQSRRLAFQKLLDQITKKKTPHHKARALVLDFMKNKKSMALKTMGIIK